MEIASGKVATKSNVGNKTDGLNSMGILYT